MRPIKFRAWDWDRKAMLQDYDIAIFQGSVYVDKSDIEHTESLERLIGETENFPLMQFTGLLDKNGKEIYEGDIVRSISHMPSVMQVGFLEGGFCMKSSDESYPIDINHFYPSVGTDLEVIGNIYSNPELIKN